MSPSSILTRVFSREDNVPVAKMDDGMLAINRSAGYCYSMNPTSTRIWELLSEPRSVLSICDALCHDFNVDRETCLQDVVSVTAEMEKAGLVR